MITWQENVLRVAQDTSLQKLHVELTHIVLVPTASHVLLAPAERVMCQVHVAIIAIEARHAL